MRIIGGIIKFLMISILIIVVSIFTVSFIDKKEPYEVYNQLTNTIEEKFDKNANLAKLRKEFDNNKNWNINKDPLLKEINVARYAFKTNRIDTYMWKNTPKKARQKKSYLCLVKQNRVCNVDNQTIARGEQMFPIKFSKQIYDLALDYAKTGALDTQNLVHSPNNPKWVGKDKNLPNYDKWNIDSTSYIKRESIANGDVNVYDVVRNWINEDNNIEHSDKEVLGHRMHILDNNFKNQFGAVVRTNKNGWIYQSGFSKNKNDKVIQACDFVNLNKNKFSVQFYDIEGRKSLYPLVYNTLNYNPKVCDHIKILAYYYDEFTYMRKPIKVNAKIDSKFKSVIFIQIPDKGYALDYTNLRNKSDMVIKIWKGERW